MNSCQRWNFAVPLPVEATGRLEPVEPLEAGRSAQTRQTPLPQLHSETRARQVGLVRSILLEPSVSEIRAGAPTRRTPRTSPTIERSERISAWITRITPGIGRP